MASGPIISWEIKGENVEIVSDFIFLGSKITAVSDCNHEMKRHLLLGWEDPLEEGMVTHSSILAWRTSWTEEPGGLQFMGLQRVGHD